MEKVKYREKVREEIHSNKTSFIVFVILNALTASILVRHFFQGEYESVFVCFLTMALLLVPAMVQVSFKMELPTTLEIIIFFFIFAAEILGEINAFYIRFAWWDTALHTLNGFLAAAIGLSMIVLLNHNDRLAFTLSPLFVAITAFCFSMTIGVMWEFFEFGLDYFLGLDTQKDTIITTINTVILDETNSNKVISVDGIETVVVNGEELGVGGYIDIGLYDTMKDLLVNFIGAVIFSILGYFYSKNHGKGKLAKKFMPVQRKKI